jgi:hypothetical protein
MAVDDGAFDFVQHEPNAALSRENRSKIRRHAMRAVRSERAAAKRGEAIPSNRYPLQRQLQPAPVSGLELLVKKYGLDPLDLSALTSVHLGAMYVRWRSQLGTIPANMSRPLALQIQY